MLNFKHLAKEYAAMQHPLTITTLFITLLGLAVGSVQASDAAKEKRWADQVVDSILVGDALWLEVSGQKILSIYTENATAKARGAAIILHGKGVHPNWADVIHPLRTQLPDYGWHTLSVQMPILANEATNKEYAPLFDEAAPRINAAIATLKSKGINNIVLIAHSIGAAMSTYYLANNPKSGVLALVGIGMGGKREDPRMDNTVHLQKITIPTLDLYGSQDLDDVLSSAKKRASAARKADNKNYHQRKIEGANHFFRSMDDTLVKQVRGWLFKYAAGTEVKK